MEYILRYLVLIFFDMEGLSMLFFGHIGITTGAFLLADSVSAKLTHRYASNPKGENQGISNRLRKIDSIIREVDMRIIMVGSLLPDIIDKPLGHYLLKDFFSNGRIFSHSLLFLILISLIGLVFYKTRRRTWMLALAFGTFIHLILDQMWEAPSTLLWPVYGWAFPREDVSNFIPKILHAMVTVPADYISELFGLAILIYFFVRLVRQKKLTEFLKHGRF